VGCDSLFLSVLGLIRSLVLYTLVLYTLVHRDSS
jgi:hypothetical protein